MTAIRCAAALACALLASTASAQDLLTAGGRAFGAVAWFGQDLGPAQQVSEDSVFGGGRFSVGWVAWTNTTTVFDGRTGQSASFPGYLLAADKARPRVFVARTDGIASIDVTFGGETQVWTGDGARVQQCAHAESPNRLFCAVARNDGRSDVLAIDVPPNFITILATKHPCITIEKPFGQRAPPC